MAYIYVTSPFSPCPSSQVARSELEAKASKSAGETAEEAKIAADAAAAASETDGVAKPDHVQIDETSFLINLIDSPGHVDFSSEVRIECSRASCVPGVIGRGG